MDRYLALPAELLIREYGSNIEGNDRIRDFLTTVRDALRWLRSETLRRMNSGMVLEDSVNEIELPADFADSPWLPQTYGCADYVVREVWRIEAGWWDRNITSLHPAPITASTDAIIDKQAVLDAAGAFGSGRTAARTARDRHAGDGPA
jgi:uncharacterized sulfatase